MARHDASSRDALAPPRNWRSRAALAFPAPPQRAAPRRRTQRRSSMCADRRRRVLALVLIGPVPRSARHHGTNGTMERTAPWNERLRWTLASFGRGEEIAGSPGGLPSEIRRCTMCAEHLPWGPRPVVQAAGGAQILITGQASGLRVHESGSPFDSPSGDRLRRRRQGERPPANSSVAPRPETVPASSATTSLPTLTFRCRNGRSSDRPAFVLKSTQSIAEHSRVGAHD